MAVRCRIGWHRWERFGGHGTPVDRCRVCMSCGRFEFGEYDGIYRSWRTPR